MEINNIKKASIIFNIKTNNVNPNLMDNFLYTLKWFMKYFPTTDYEYIIVEQDEEEKIKLSDELKIKKIFLYNPHIFNRGWGYNVAIKHYITTKIAVLCDTDIILENPKQLHDSIEISENIIQSPEIRTKSLSEMIFPSTNNHSSHHSMGQCCPNRRILRKGKRMPQ